MNLPIAIVLAALSIALLLLILHKVRRVHLMSFEISERLHRLESKSLIDLHQQLQALHALYVELQLDTGLPPTRGWSASPDFLLLLARHAKDARPETVVECGSGTSTVVLARCMQLNGSGHVYSLEHEAEFVEATRAELKRLGLSDWATVLHAPLRPHDLNGKTWPWYAHENLPELTIDMLVIDGPPITTGPLARYPAGPILFPRLSTGATIFIDDAARDHDEQTLERWFSEFSEMRHRYHDCEKGCITLTQTNT